jgi:hypothetical protein
MSDQAKRRSNNSCPHKAVAALHADSCPFLLLPGKSHKFGGFIASGTTNMADRFELIGRQKFKPVAGY